MRVVYVNSIDEGRVVRCVGGWRRGGDRVFGPLSVISAALRLGDAAFGAGRGPGRVRWLPNMAGRHQVGGLWFGIDAWNAKVSAGLGVLVRTASLLARV